MVNARSYLHTVAGPLRILTAFRFSRYLVVLYYTALFSEKSRTSSLLDF